MRAYLVPCYLILQHSQFYEIILYKWQRFIPLALRDDIKGCEKISFSLPLPILNLHFPRHVNNKEKFTIFNLTTGPDPLPTPYLKQI